MSARSLVDRSLATVAVQCGTNAAALIRHMELHVDKATRDRYAAKLKADLDGSIRKVERRYGVDLRRIARR